MMFLETTVFDWKYFIIFKYRNVDIFVLLHNIYYIKEIRIVVLLQNSVLMIENKIH